MTDTSTAPPIPCPVCDDGHELLTYALGRHTIYHCPRTLQEWVEEGAPDPTAYQLDPGDDPNATSADPGDGRSPLTSPIAATPPDETTIPLKSSSPAPPADTDVTLPGDALPSESDVTMVDDVAQPAPSSEHTIIINDAQPPASPSASQYANNPAVTQRGSVIRYLRQVLSGQEADPAADPELANRYAIDSELAEGGMGRVSLAHDRDLNRQVAVKSLLPRFLKSPQYVSKFMEEAQTIGQLEHPNIVPIYDIGIQDSGEIYFTMKYVRGDTMETVIARLKDGDAETHRQYSWAHRTQIIMQICDALQYAHQRQIIHRDLKPANVMVGEFGEVQLMDWGIAKQIEAAAATPETPAETPSDAMARSQLRLERIAPHQTRVGSVVGTAYYMSPEQATGELEKVGPASDVYSLGAVMYEFFGLQRPHEGKTAYAVLAAVMRDEPKAVSGLTHPAQGAVPIEIDYICRRAMAKDPAERFASAAELKAHLQLYLDGKYPIVCPHTALKRGATALTHLIDNHAKGLLMGLVLAVVVFLFAVVAAAVFLSPLG